MMPAYPYGPDIRYPEANEGLYGGMTIRSGNKISSGRNKGKTLRKWYPNVKVERIRSEALGKELTIPIATRVMRTIRKAGGLDEYVLGTKPARIKELGLLGWKIRWMVLNSTKYRKKYAEASGQGSDTKNPLDETFEEAWKDPARREEFIQTQSHMWGELREKDEKFKRHFMKNVISGRTTLKVPDLSTLSFYDPQSVDLANTEVEEAESPDTKPMKKERRNRVPADSVV